MSAVCACGKGKQGRCVECVRRRADVNLSHQFQRVIERHVDEHGKMVSRPSKIADALVRFLRSEYGFVVDANGEVHYER